MKYKVQALFFMLVMLCSNTAVQAEKTDWYAPESVEGTVTIDVYEANELFHAGAVFVDVRNPRLYARKHVPGAHHLDLKDGYSEQALNAIASLDDPVVIYSSGEQCARSYRASEMAVKWGYKKVYYFRGGIIDWRDAGFTMEKVNVLLEGTNN